LAEDGLTGVNSANGTAYHMVPLLENPPDTVNGLEAAAYRRFVADYNRYWRTYFDPIGMRVQATAGGSRVENLILPLIDDSLYTEMARLFKGKPVPLDEASGHTFLSLAARLDKEGRLAEYAAKVDDSIRGWGARELGLSDKEFEAFSFKKLLTRGLGDRV